MRLKHLLRDLEEVHLEVRSYEVSLSVTGVVSAIFFTVNPLKDAFGEYEVQSVSFTAEQGGICLVLKEAKRPELE